VSRYELEAITPMSGGLALRQLVVPPKPNEQALWEEINRIRFSWTGI
jgi:hypothetical protein